MSTEVRAYIRSLDIGAYVVGGAVRDELLGIPHDDEDFLVPGVDHDGLRALLTPHGRVEDMEVHGQLVGVRLFPGARRIRRLVPAGIELTPPRVETSTGPAHKDFRIVTGGSVTVEQDMARRDFTVNAMARSLETGELLDPFGGAADLRDRLLRTVSDNSFREDPLRILRGLRLVSQLGFRLAPETEARMRRDVQGLRHVSGERIGGGIAADGMGELSKLLLGREPGLALRLARDIGALQIVIPEFAAAVGHTLGSERQPAPLDEHLIAVTANAAAAGAPLEVRLAALLHDLGKPLADAESADHALLGADVAGAVLRRLRYPSAVIRRVRRIVAGHAFRGDAPWEPVEIRRFLALHGDSLAADLVALKRADLAAKIVQPDERAAVERLAGGLVAERESAHRLGDLAIDGTDLLELGYREGPELGAVLRRLLDEVVEDPDRNTRDSLLGLAAEWRP
jgi:tRNA nucleotidyltransferase/poly(A) polymerase